MKKYINKDINIPSKKKEIYRHIIIDYWSKIIKEGINWFYFLNIMEFTSYTIKNEIELLMSLLNMCSMFQMRCWYNKGHFDKNRVKNISIRCSNCGKETGLSMKNINTNYKDIITSFVLNTVLHNVAMSWIIKSKKHLEYDVCKNNSD